MQLDYESHTLDLPVYSAEYYTEGSEVVNKSLHSCLSSQTFDILGSPNLTSKTGQKLISQNKFFKNDNKDNVRRIREELSMWKNSAAPVEEDTCICGVPETNRVESVIQSPLHPGSQLLSSSG